MLSLMTNLVLAAGAWAGTVFYAADGDERKAEPPRRDAVAREEGKRDEPKREEAKKEEPKREDAKRPDERRPEGGFRPDGGRPVPGRGPTLGGGPRPPFDPEKMKEFRERMEHFRHAMTAGPGHRPGGDHGEGRGAPEKKDAATDKKPGGEQRCLECEKAERCPECEKLAARHSTHSWHSPHARHSTHARHAGRGGRGEYHAARHHGHEGKHAGRHPCPPHGFGPGMHARHPGAGPMQHGHGHAAGSGHPPEHRDERHLSHRPEHEHHHGDMHSGGGPRGNEHAGHHPDHHPGQSHGGPATAGREGPHGPGPGGPRELEEMSQRLDKLTKVVEQLAEVVNKMQTSNK